GRQQRAAPQPFIGEQEGESRASREFRAGTGIVSGIFKGLFSDLPRLIIPGEKPGEVGVKDILVGTGRSFKNTFTGQNVRRALKGDITWTEALFEDILNVGSVVATIGTAGLAGPAVGAAGQAVRAGAGIGQAARAAQASIAGARAAASASMTSRLGKTAQVANATSAFGTPSKAAQMFALASRPYRSAFSATRKVLDNRTIQMVEEGVRGGSLLGARRAWARSAQLDVQDASQFGARQTQQTLLRHAREISDAGFTDPDIVAAEVINQGEKVTNIAINEGLVLPAELDGNWFQKAATRLVDEWTKTPIGKRKLSENPVDIATDAYVNLHGGASWRQANAEMLGWLRPAIKQLSPAEVGTKAAGTVDISLQELGRLARQTDWYGKKLNKSGAEHTVTRLNKAFGDGLPDWWHAMLRENPDQIVRVPKGLVKQMESWAKWDKVGNALGFSEKGATLFRSAVLAHSPRWAFNSFMGNLM
ncbi:MAG: hypothetical protein ACRDGA_10030, partial [Bacteroidota bacterium]